MATRTKDYYEILGVGEKAKADELKKAYRKLAKQYHPDTHPDDPKAAERFKEVSEAYRVLSDDDQRRKYDQMRRFGGLGGLGFGRPGSAPRGGPQPGGFRFEDLGDTGGLGDLFGSIFDFGRRAARKPKPPSRGQNVEYLVEVPFRTAARGGKVNVTIPIVEACATCDGAGMAPGGRLLDCAECGGTGRVTFGQGTFSVQRPCPNCLARGTIPDPPCSDCDGRGEVRSRRKISVTVPPGVETGSKVRIPGQGERGPAGGKSGDLIIQFRVKDDRFFKRDGLNVVCEVPINIAQAMLGSRLRVRTVDNKKIVLKIPPGTQGGTTFRIRGHGIQKGGAHGDQLVRVRIEAPTDLSEGGKQAAEQLAEAEGLRY
ncbi:MAG: molecular chaperone DnaJ [Gemmatimonadales bacterium]|jgi:molecular chaperone DnaJ